MAQGALSLVWGLRLRLPESVCVRAGREALASGSASTQPPYLCPHREASPVYCFQGLALLNLAGGKSSLCRPGTQRQSATGKSHPRGVFNELWMHCSCAQGARAAGPGLTDPAQAFGAKHCLELRQDNTMWASEGKKKKKTEEEKYWKFPMSQLWKSLS